MAQQMPLPLTISTLAPVNPDWFYLPGFYLSGAYSPGWSRTNSRKAVKRLCVGYHSFDLFTIWIRVRASVEFT